MISEKFFHSKTAITTLFAACFVVLISLGVRQVFGLFFIDFNESLNISNTAFGFAIGIQMLMWGMTGPIFGAIADRYGGHVAIISAFIFYTLGIYFLYTGPNTGIFAAEVILTGFLHDVDGDGDFDTVPRTGGTGPTNGFLESERDSAVTVSFEFADGLVLTESFPVTWNVGTIKFENEEAFSLLGHEGYQLK